MTHRRTACSAATRNPREITILLAFICEEPSCIQKHHSPLRFVYQLLCTSLCIQRGILGLSTVCSADELFITQDFAFWYVTLFLFPFQLKPETPPHSLPQLVGIFTRECGLTDGVTLTGVTCDTEWPRGVWFCSEPRSPSFVPNIRFVSLIFISTHQIITWPGVISLVSAPDNCFHLISNMASWWLYQATHSSALFSLSQSDHFTSLSSLPPSVRSSCVVKRRIKNSSVGYFSQRMLSVESLRITVILSFLDQTKTVVS